MSARGENWNYPPFALERSLLLIDDVDIASVRNNERLTIQAMLYCLLEGVVENNERGGRHIELIHPLFSNLYFSEGKQINWHTYSFFHQTSVKKIVLPILISGHFFGIFIEHLGDGHFVVKVVDSARKPRPESIMRQIVREIIGINDFSIDFVRPPLIRPQTDNISCGLHLIWHFYRFVHGNIFSFDVEDMGYEMFETSNFRAELADNMSTFHNRMQSDIEHGILRSETVHENSNPIELRVQSNIEVQPQDPVKLPTARKVRHRKVNMLKRLFTRKKSRKSEKKYPPKRISTMEKLKQIEERFRTKSYIIGDDECECTGTKLSIIREEPEERDEPHISEKNPAISETNVNLDTDISYPNEDDGESGSISDTDSIPELIRFRYLCDLL